MRPIARFGRHLPKGLLVAIGHHDGSEPSGAGIRFEPAAWFRQTATPARRQQWSLWTKQQEQAGLLECMVEPSRDRVIHVRLTKFGRAWLDEHVGFQLLPVDLKDLAESND